MPQMTTKIENITPARRICGSDMKYLSPVQRNDAPMQQHQRFGANQATGIEYGIRLWYIFHI